MAKKRTSRRASAAAAKERAARAGKVRDSAMLGLSPGDAAEQLGVTHDQFIELLRDDDFAAAWRDGRLKLVTSVHGDLIRASKDGKVAASFKLLDLARVQPAAPEPADDEAEGGAVERRALREGSGAADAFSSLLETQWSQRDGRGAAGAGGAGGHGA